MRILNKKISLVAIFAIAFTIIISLFIVNNGQIQNSNTDSLTGNKVSIATVASSDSEEPVVQAYMDSSIDSMENHLRDIINAKEIKVKILSINQTNHSYYMPDAINQNYLNYMFSTKYGYEITDTCSLVAMTMAILYIESINDELAITYETTSTYAKDCLVFFELYEISVAEGNVYVGDNQTGTYLNTFYTILNQFYENHGYDEVPIECLSYASNIMNNVYNHAYVPAILSIEGISYENNVYDMHSVVLCGYYNYETKYKLYPWYNYVVGYEYNEDYKVEVVINGWRGGTDGNIGNHLQLILYTDNANYAHVCHINGWLDYYE